MNHVYEIQTQAKLLYVDGEQTVVDCGKVCWTVEETDYEENERIFQRAWKCSTFCDMDILKGIVKTHCWACKICGFHHIIIIQLFFFKKRASC